MKSLTADSFAAGVFHSLLKLSTGFVLAALNALNKTDPNAITTHITTDITNTSAEMFVL